MPFKPEPNLLAGPMGRKVAMGPQMMSLQTEGKPPPPKAPSGVRVEDRIGIQAPAEVIWEIVRDLESWREWNPTYPQASGQVRIGELVTVTLALPGQPPQELKPRILDWVPNEQLHWELKMMGGMIKTLRYIEIQSLGEASSIVDNGEIFGGLMGPSMGRRVGRAVRQGFKAMNEALKARAEAQWAAHKG